MTPSYAITMVIYDNARHLPATLAALARLDPLPSQVIVADNGSKDEGAALCRASSSVTSVLALGANRGFTGGQNAAMREARAEVVLCLNPDALVTPAFAAAPLAVLARDPAIGMVSGKLLRTAEGYTVPQGPAVIDSTGIVWTRNGRHLDRGADEPDRGQYQTAEEIFGPSGAAAFYRRSMLEDVAVDGQFFDEDFATYREDADLAWRARLYGHRGWYEPAAVAYHERRVTPERRARLSAYVNYHSVKNRFLLRLKNEGAGMFLRNGPRELARDLMVVGYVLLRERASWGALAEVARTLPRTLAKRRQIQARRRVPDRELMRWFGGA